MLFRVCSGSVSLYSIGEAAKTEFLFHERSDGHAKVSQAVTKILEARKITHHLRSIYEVYSSESMDEGTGKPSLNLLRFPGFLGETSQQLARRWKSLACDLFSEPVSLLIVRSMCCRFAGG